MILTTDFVRNFDIAQMEMEIFAAQNATFCYKKRATPEPSGEAPFFVRKIVFCAAKLQ